MTLSRYRQGFIPPASDVVICNVMIMENKQNVTTNPTVRITDIVGNLVKADQGAAKPAAKTEATNQKPTDPNDDEIVVLNVGGIRHETKIATLLKRPETRLCSIAETAKASGKRYFFFDRNPQIFPCVLNYYRIGKLHMPSDLCGPAAKAELDYWELEDKDIEQCCWVNYISYEETMEMLEKFEEDDKNKYHSVYVSPEASLYARYQPKFWKAFQDPYSSIWALVMYFSSRYLNLQFHYGSVKPFNARPEKVIPYAYNFDPS